VCGGKGNTPAKLPCIGNKYGPASYRWANRPTHPDLYTTPTKWEISAASHILAKKIIREYGCQLLKVNPQAQNQ
jgi:hypothetical protein